MKFSTDILPGSLWITVLRVEVQFKLTVNHTVRDIKITTVTNTLSTVKTQYPK
jgi:hypothetical protein